MAKMGGGQGSMAAETRIHQKGMKDRAPQPVDASMRCKGGSVNNDTTRRETAPTPKTIGPREA
jgi:hypothetical protein